ncbi:MAG: hypothetical protein QOE66_222, partial [Chloroflexota bacterium]|nr:hypothetical protein [Chloroflexota bacterium]
MSMELQQALEQVARRFRHVRLWSGLALCWLAWALVGLGLSFLLSRPGMMSAPIPGGLLLASFASLTSVTAIACAILALRSARDPRWVARRIEARLPELGTGLLAAVEQDATSSSGGLGFLQNAVIREALEHSWVHDWDQTVPTRRLLGLQLAHAAALALLIVAFAALVAQARTQPGGLLAMLPVTIPGTGALEVTVEPGNTELERGGALLVVARFRGGAPADANLVVGDDRSTEASRPMTRSLEDPTFAGRVEPVNADLAYRVAFAGRETETYKVHVFEYPELQRTDARLVFPHYTSLEQKNVDDIRHVTAVEGTELTLLCRLNKDVAVARLVDEKGKVLELTPHEEGTHTYRTTFVLADSHRYRVQLVDRDKRPNKLPAEIVVNVTRNHPPVVKMTQPAHDVRVSPVEELTLKAELEDDFGLVRQGISYTLAGQEPREIALNGIEAANQTKTSTKGNRKSPTPIPTRQARAEHLLAFESLRARPDQLVTYFFWAEDVGPDGQPRRTSGDMFFAEVRPFEEIFRQGEQPPSDSAANEEQQGGNAQEAGKLAELQKEIINGTWKLIRRETGAKPSARFADDSRLLRESQHSAIEQAAQLAEKLRDPVSKANLDQATQFMKDAEKHLAEAVAASAIAPQRPALVAEQSAYQALLKLRAREFNVVRRNSRQRQQGGGAGAGSPSDRQLQQLELSNEENRY